MSTARAALVGASEARGPLARVVVRTPQGVAAGDLLLGVVSVRAGSGQAVATPPGWRRVRTIGRRAGELAQALFVRWAGVSEPRFHTWKLRHPRGGIGAIVAYRGVDPLQPILDHAGGGARRSASIALPALDVPAEEALLVGFVAGTGAGRTAPPAGMRERYDAARGGRWALTAAAFDAAEVSVARAGERRAKFNRKREVLVAQVVGLQPASDAPVLPPTSVPPPPPPGDTDPPPPPSGLEVMGQTTQSVSLDWSGVYIDDVVGYSVYVNGTKVVDRAQGATYYTVPGLSCGTSYSFAVDSFDAAGNHSAPESVTGSTSACAPADTTPPSTPSGLATTGATPTSVSLDWEAASDNVAVTSYGVYRNGTKVADAVLSAHTVSGLVCGTSYTFAVDAADAAGNRSAQTALTASTAACPPPDTTPPTTPSGLISTGSTPTSVSLDWNASSDDVAVTSYGVYRNGTKVADPVLSAHTVGGLACGTSYTFAVDAADAAGNRSAQASITAATSACTPPPPPPPSGCPALLTPPPPGYCTGTVISVTPSTFGIGIFGPGGIPIAPGDVVVFEDGVYTDTSPGDGTIVQIASGGTSSQYVTFVSRNRWGAKIDGVSNTSKYGFSFAALTGNVRIEGFDIYGLGSRDVGTLVAPSASGVFLQAGGDNSQIVGNSIHAISNFCNDTIRGQTGVFIQRPGVVVESNVFHGIGRLDPGEDGCTYPSTFTKYRSSDTAVYLQSPNHNNVTIRNNLFSKLENGYGVFVYQGGPSGLKVLNNTFAGGNPYCKNAHIFTDADMNDFQVKNNVFHGPATGYAWAWDLEPLTNVVVSQNVASGGLLVSGANCSSGISPLPSGVTESGNQLNTDPKLVDPNAPLTGGSKLQSSSPAIDAGANLSALGVTVDFDGATRPQGAGFDIGAYEFAGAPPPGDTQAPSAPTNLTKTGSTTTSISVSWTASTDNVGVTGYERYRDGTLVSSGAGTSYTFSGLTCGTSYQLGVDAYDSAGNRSARTSLTGSTAACAPPPSGCPTLMTPTPVPGYCTGDMITVTPATFGSGTFGSGGIAVSPGDVVIFEDGTYTDTNGDGAVMRITGSGTATQWVTFVSRTKWGARMWGDSNDAAEGISLDGANYVRVEGFEVSDVGNVGSPRGSASGIDLYNGGKNSHIVGNHIHHVGRVCTNPDNTNGQVGIYIQTGKNGGNIVVENNLVHDIGRFFVGENGCGNTTTSLDHGMYLNGSAGGGGGASNITIRNNIFHDTHHGWGVQWYPGSLDNIHVLNNTFAFCNESKSYTCIVLDATITNSSIKNNVFYNPQGGKTIEAAGFAGAITIGTNLTSGNAMHDQGSTPSGMALLGNLLSTNAQLVGPPTDFHLLSTSPAIDTGEALSSVAVDHEGRSRPQGSGFDMGAYEFGG